ncbi:hypothetical protein O7614_26710 [Micromonospora sp. WMMD961]|uniref:VG15 protein n=1 Tax=Micromonospora sp. WMMD961 TaxID=3016100 RepID=UPI0024173580|nr:hypothetical protein [Micromonospora sp. WMMD961]MDG4783257.1 hypothetical protein [Micromonospora sp. WMMD961]
MTTAARAAEADKASVAFHAALTQIGAATIEDALKLWAGVPPTTTAATAARWLADAVHLVMTRRSRSRDLAMAYYRLARALRTGKTVADPRRPEPKYVTLAMLRREFELLAGDPLAEPLEGRERTTPAADDSQSRPGSGSDEELIEVEEIPDSAREEERLERAAEQEARDSLIKAGPLLMRKKLLDVDTREPAEKVDEQRDEAHQAAGRQQSSTAERVTLDGARGTVWRYAERDRRVIGYVRLSRTGTPCGWCAMLISRGVAYKSQRGAEYSDGDKYHNNCHCYAEPIYDKQQYATSELTALNREYQKLWPQVTAGLSGKAAVRAWRKFIREQEKDRAQAARQQTAQEA